MRMLYGRLLHIMVCVVSTQSHIVHSLKFDQARFVYSASLQAPSCNFLLKFVNKLIGVSKQSYLRAKRELFVDDVNKRLDRKEIKLLIVLEQSELFKRCNNVHYNDDGSEVNFSDNDKVLLPVSFFECCKSGNYNVPFQLLIHKVHVPEPYYSSKPPELLLSSDLSKSSRNLVTNSSESLMETKRRGPPNIDSFPNTAQEFIPPSDVSNECVSCSAIEFRTDENYVYVPKWIMNNLKLKPFDVVLVELIKLDDCTNVELKCLEREFYETNDIKKVLEERLKYYSTLTLNSVIPITIGDVTFNFKVVRLDTTNQRNVPFASIQDIDLNVKLL
ncbi:ubiquitin-fusion degradation pathway component [Theileria orientalis strain Shintoku]|uniref:Ubiquitin-fusion degradation pathway component n=1 Tax=Theileria orientalis strain Shintoku TaxID=869250 RepID=J4D6K0_THEOR|nr:ubiquitin-fusion degradation pathway component [Theileria orientalis strain Shintoku]PVC49594.1 ubiquitin-fusion degradation pathway component [Theileria orientalis]BAM39625.1 ubiquitin-fusion degradation pathway component [Theileria orientalis strain Shintoku]|eukprot:XP_009689926.1 ubiquitin-fusion degradation pathway component [Theileria orientalis strain Shintoku]